MLRTPRRSAWSRARVAGACAAAVCGTLLVAGTGSASAVDATASPSGASPPALSGGKILTIATNQSVDSLSPFLASRALAMQIHRLMYDFLTSYDPVDEHPIPGLASSWAASPDKLTWTFNIRDNAKWSDGQPVTADDVAWTLNLMMTNPDAATANGNFVANFKTVTAAGNQVTIVLSRPQATMLALDVPIVPKHAWESHASDVGKFNNDTAFPVIGGGPFILTGYSQGQYIELSANPTYWRGKAGFDKLVFKNYKDTDAEVEALKKGEVDFAYNLTAAQYDSLKNTANIKLNSTPDKRFYALMMNPGATTKTNQAFGDSNPALKDENVRHAIMHAIDPKVLVVKTLGGYGVAGAGYIPSVFAQYRWTPDASMAYKYDPATANQLLDAAGYKKGSDGMRTTPDGTPFTLRLLGETDRAANADNQNATYISEWLKAVGVRVSVSIVDGGKLADTLLSGEYDLAFDSWAGYPDPDFLLNIQTCNDRPDKPNSSNSTTADFICDADYDQLYQKQIGEYDPAARAEIVKQMQAKLYKDAYYNILYYPNVLEAYRSDVIGSMQKQPQPDGMYWGQDGYWSWWSAAPPTIEQAAVAKKGSSGSSDGAIIGGIAVVAVILAAGSFLVARRRRSSAEDRE